MGAGRGHVRFYPYKREGGNVLAMLKGGYVMFWGSFYVVALAILKGGTQRVLPCLKGGGRKTFRTRDFPIW